ncbi:hypothetical protein FJZ28_02665 [Candidatus Peregrinibacteria bacterium]|nr:hypothetical protein [Candidatus Peregrinibacteria bacterium]
MLQVSLLITLFTAGLLTILLPCILPLLPIVLGVSIAGRSRLRPLAVMAGMLVSFVGFTFLLLVVLNQFVTAAEYIRISTYYALLLFGFGFLTANYNIQLIGVVLGGFFYTKFGWIVVTVAQCAGWAAMELGTRVATKIQQLGSNIQQNTTARLGADNPLSAFIISLTMGLVWVPCAGPALGFAFTLVREEPGLQAFLYLTAYGLGSVRRTRIGFCLYACTRRAGSAGVSLPHSVWSGYRHSSSCRRVRRTVGRPFGPRARQVQRPCEADRGRDIDLHCRCTELQLVPGDCQPHFLRQSRCRY